MAVTATRIRALNQAQVSASGQYVLYWMIAARRPRRNFALQRARDWALELKVPLVVLEPLRIGYPWASERLHAFAIEGMAANAAYFETSCATYYPYLEPAEGAGSGLLEALAERASVVVTDDHPGFFYPRMLEASGRLVRVRLEAIDSNGLLPLSVAQGRAFATAFSFRRFLQHELPRHLDEAPEEEPLIHAQLPKLKKLPAALRLRFPAASHAQLSDVRATVRRLSLDRSVSPIEPEGGWIASHWHMQRFVNRRLPRYLERQHPDETVSSGLSPYLHFGHLSAHDLFRAVADVEGWERLPEGHTTNGSRDGFWGMSGPADAFLEELVTWRELAFNSALCLSDYDRYESLPSWALRSLEAHSKDKRPYLYDLSELERAETHDGIWNAAQRQLVREGTIHNYLRMLWGKKILEWSQSPKVAFEHMVHLNNKYALDGRDPNSIAGIAWTLGRYDRPWAPERAIFGMVRYMSSASTRKKLRLNQYLERFGEGNSLYDELSAS